MASYTVNRDEEEHVTVIFGRSVSFRELDQALKKEFNQGLGIDIEWDSSKNRLDLVISPMKARHFETFLSRLHKALKSVGHQEA